jgi:dephospho-CoA kinase
LIESGLNADCDAIWLVVCDPDIATRRLVDRNGLSYDDASVRVRAQPDISPKRAIADAIIDNSGTRESTRDQVAVAWTTVRPSSSPSANNP